MRDVTTLISKYGEQVSHNGVFTSIFIDEDKSVFQKKQVAEYLAYSGVNILAVMTRSRVGEKDIFVIDNNTYKVLSTNEIKKKGRLVYTDALLFKDDFTHEIRVYKQGMSMQECNLPSVESRPFVTIKARIRTKSAQDYVTFALHNSKQITHVFTIEHEHGIETADLVAWGARRFEIVHKEEPDEDHKLMILSCIEVLRNG